MNLPLLLSFQLLLQMNLPPLLMNLLPLLKILLLLLMNPLQ